MKSYNCTEPLQFPNETLSLFIHNKNRWSLQSHGTQWSNLISQSFSKVSWLPKFSFRNLISTQLFDNNSNLSTLTVSPMHGNGNEEILPHIEGSGVLALHLSRFHIVSHYDFLTSRRAFKTDHCRKRWLLSSDKGNVPNNNK